MTDDEFRMMLDLWMVSDPWPLSGRDSRTLHDMLMRLSKERGFEGIVAAYHDFKPGGSK